MNLVHQPRWASLLENVKHLIGVERCLPNLLAGADLAIAVARAFSIFFDKSYDKSNLISLAIECVFGLLLVV